MLYKWIILYEHIGVHNQPERLKTQTEPEEIGSVWFGFFLL